MIILTLLAASLSYAAPPQETVISGQYPTTIGIKAVTPVEGEVLKGSYISGDREFAVYYGVAKNVPADIPIKITENTCSTGRFTTQITQAPKCKFKLELHLGVADVRWTQHPDSTNIGKRVKTLSFLQDADVYEFYEDQYFGRSNPDHNGPLKPFEIVCDDYSWLPHQSNGEVLITAFRLESMTRNPETDSSENNTLSLFSDVVFKPTQNGTLAFSSLKGIQDSSYDVGFLGKTFLLGSNLVSLTLIENNQPCEIAIGTDFSNFLKVYDDYKRIAQQNAVPFVYRRQHALTQSIILPNMVGRMSYLLRAKVFIENGTSYTTFEEISGL